MKPTTLTLLALLVAGFVSMPSGFKAGSFALKQDGNVPVVEWSAESEEGLQHYEVHVTSRYESRAETVDKKGADVLYVYRDTQLYKESGERVEYEVFAILEGNAKQSVGRGEIDYIPTAVHRTWGSIKAMFQ